MKFYRPLNISAYPNSVYKNKGWVSSSDFFGNKKDYWEEFIIDIEKLTEDNGGTLPCSSWLNNNGHRLLNESFNHPNIKGIKELKHIKQDKEKQATLEEWIIIAKDLEKEHGGCLPSPEWLIENGYCNLFGCIFENAGSFHYIIKDESWSTFKHVTNCVNGQSIKYLT